MTPQEKLHAVETAIRKALPRLTKPTEGCWLKHKHKSESYNLYKVCEHNGNDELEVSDILILTPTGRIKIAWFDHEDELESFNNTFTIVGHDILLSDILEWLKTLRKNFKLDSDILVVFVDDFTLKKSSINLSKPYLKDQSEELWNFLYNLIKE